MTGFCLAPTMRAALLALSLLVLLPAACSAADRPAHTDPEGYWLGEVEMEQQRYQIGFEFRRKADGQFTGRQWFAALHLFGSACGDLSATGNRLRSPNLGLDLAYNDDILAGTINGAYPLRLTRSAALLTTPPTPTYPEGPASAWTYHAGAGFWASPAADHELVIIGDERGRLHAVRLHDGSAAWHFDSGAPIHGTACLDRDSVYLLNDAGRLLHLARTTGHVRWERTIGGGEIVRQLPAATEFSYDFAGARPALADDTLYVPAADGSIVAVATADGSIRWRAPVGGLLRQSVLVAGSRLVATSWSGRIAALARSDGALLWSFETGQPATADPVACGDSVLVSSRNSKLHRLALADGAVRWTRFHAGSWIESAPRLDGGSLFIGSSDLRTVTCLDPETGRERWSTDVLGWTWGTPAVTGELVFAGTAGALGYPIAQDGGMVALDRRTGAPRWRIALQSATDRYVTGIPGSPLVAGTLVLFADRAGTLHAFPARTRD